ncbi:carboxypeptidase B-like [Bicyclus anynana]|uniref:Carboxypeptidase B-like n=1 Tax=Bicyclus anynana TaxID=110368 RepID=A0ABM3LXV9_BICAN|nr:carboxypeptidase B-like [Bicyclus anynana]
MTKLDNLQEDTTVIKLKEPEESDEDYLSAYSIKKQLQDIIQKIPDVNVTLTVIGRTKSYLDIVLLKITKAKDAYFKANEKYVDEKPEKKIIFIVHGLSVMGIQTLPCLSTATSFLKLLEYYLQYLDIFDIFLIPMANPDGYAKSKVPTSVWNKNAAPQTDCIGVALDRNFDVAWSNNSTISSCNQEYPGQMSFSEEESQAIRDIFHKYNHKIAAYLNVHAGTYGSETFKGDAVLYPHGYTDAITDEDKFIDLKGEIDEAIRNASFQVYSVTVDTLYNWYGRVNGASVDYASTIYGIPFALELVMQPYDDEDVSGDNVTFSDSALTQVWGRIIDVIFKFVSKSFEKDNETR